jgi:hypothetical protein
VNCLTLQHFTYIFYSMQNFKRDKKHVHYNTDKYFFFMQLYLHRKACQKMLIQLNRLTALRMRLTNSEAVKIFFMNVQLSLLELEVAASMLYKLCVIVMCCMNSGCCRLYSNMQLFSGASICLISLHPCAPKKIYHNGHSRSS